LTEVRLRVRIGRLRPRDLDEAYRYQRVYLTPGRRRFERCFRARPDLFVAARVGDRMAGICWGRPCRGRIFLDGIAVFGWLWRNGIGSAMLREFEARVAAAGGSTISLVSAGGFVDRFYLKNGYSACQLRLRLPRKRRVNRPRGFEVDQVRRSRGPTFLYVHIGSLSHKWVEHARRAFRAEEANLVFEKEVPGRKRTRRA